MGGSATIDHSLVVVSQISSSSEAVCNPNSLHSLLHVVHLHMQDAHYRTKTAQSGESQHLILEPWRIYEKVPEDKVLVDVLTWIFTATIPTSTPNCLILWHGAWLSLTANIHLFEIALRPKGLRSSISAMNQVALWTRTPAARRACLHAGEIFHTILHRRVSDLVNLHTALSLFRAALVLGLYVLNHAPEQSPNANDPLELLSSFAWDEIGKSGLGGPISGRDSLHAKAFIDHGGDFCISGEVYAAGYPNARRVLLHFADLMENLGKWKSRRFSRILHLVSEDLTYYDRTDDEGSDHSAVELSQK